MKKNLTKLALSGAALAAVAATLGTSTYAWYTTNPTVSANNIVGASSDSGASSIYIAKDPEAGQAKRWSSEVTFDDDDFETFKLIPVQPAASGFKLLDGTTNAAATDVLTFSLWFKSSKTADEVTYATETVTAQTFTTDGSLYTRTGNEGAYVYTQVTSGEFSSTATYCKVTNGIDLYLKELSIANITDADASTDGNQLPAADNLLYGDTTYGASDYGVTNDDPTYTVNFVNALGMRIVDTTNTAITKQTFALDQWETNASKTGMAGTVTTGKAHAYYNQVMTTDLTQQQIETGQALTADYAKTAVTTLNPTGTNETARKLTFYVYLNGWNDFCYDACQGQQFALNMKFTKVAGDALAVKTRS